ncbi:MAG: hypothetical protein J5494_01635 [Candidatus Methanomethylophilaceae archaeon]|nr:hypothetical protein [Candidatus Methanomethylophilaceae archaeon]
MSEDLIVIKDFRELNGILDHLQKDFPDMVRDSLEDAFIHSGVMEDIWRRTPKSERAKYGERIGVSKRDGTGLVPHWRDKVTKEQSDKLDAYGMTRLANSLLPSGVGTGLDQLGYQRTQIGWEFSITSSVPYAARMHETEKPAEGDYWTPGNGGYGWSTQGTGRKFIEDKIDPDRMGKILADRMTARMRA